MLTCWPELTWQVVACLEVTCLQSACIQAGAWLFSKRGRRMAKNTLIFVAIVLGVVFLVFFLKARDAVQVAQLRARPPASATNSVNALAQQRLEPPAPQKLEPLAQQKQESPPPVGGRSPQSDSIPSTTAARGAAESLPSVEGMTTNSEALRRDLQKDIQTLQNQLTARRRLVQERTAALQQMREQAAAAARDRETASTTDPSSGGDAVTTPAAIEERGEQLRALSSDLSQMREAREALYQQEEQAVMLRENQNRLAIAQIDAQLVQAEEARAATQAQIDRWSRDHAFVNGQVARNPDLESKLQQNQQQIETLRQQRLALTEDLHVQTDTIYNLSQQARDQLRSEEQEVRTQIFSLQNEIRRIQQAQVQTRRSEQTQSAQLQQAQRALQSETEQLRQLEASLATKQSELRRLQ